jgi:serine O-acetyltransferase
MSTRRTSSPDAAVHADPADLAALAAHIAEDDAAMFGRLPDRELVAAFAENIIGLLFPAGREAPRTPAGIQAELEARSRALILVLEPIRDRLPQTPEVLAQAFHASLPHIHGQLTEDARAIEAGDPAASGTAEVVLAYPGFHALAFYRVAHALHRQGIPLVPRMIAEFGHSRTGADIHPAARIGRRCCIDHGTGLVIGETAVIGDDVKLYQGVTLGALSVTKEASGTKRHPTIEDRVVIYANATVLGGDTIVGSDSVIGGNVWLTHSVPSNSLVYHQSQVRVRTVAEVADPIDFVI